tara:strand:+ start:653 stop:3619 length:2967 start_codon:yes stop_codon:yes gene_type:complete
LGQIKVNLPNESFTVKIAGDTPTIEEELKLAELIRTKRRSSTVRQQQSALQQQAQQEQLIDKTSGIKDASLRAVLSAAENPDEKEKALRNIYGLGEGDYFRDRLGNFGITQSGGAKLGIDLEKDTMIDERGFSRYDIADLAGVLPDIAGGVGGTLGGAAIGTAILPGIGTFIGGAIGAGLGTAGAGLAEEGAEILSGMSAQSAEEIARDAKVNFLIGAGSELAIGGAIKIVAPFFRGMKGSALPEEDLKLAGMSMEMGMTPSIGAVGGSNILARQQKIGEKALGGSKRLKENYDAMMKKINGYKDEIGVPVGQITDEEAGRTLIASISSKNAALKNAEREAKESVIGTFESIAADMGAAAAKDENLNQAIFSSLGQALKNFDELSATKYASIDAAIKKAVGSEGILDTSLLKAQADILQKQYGPAIQAAGLSPSAASEAKAAQAIINGFKGLSDKASFGQLYNLRRELFDASFSFQGQGGGSLLKDAVKLADNLMSPASIEAAGLTAGKAIDSEGMAILMQAAQELPEARRFFRQGMDAVDKMETATGIKNLMNAVRTGQIPPNVDFFKAIVKTGKPEALKKTLDVVTKNAGKQAAEDLRQRLASEYLRDAVAKTALKSDDPLVFRGAAFATAIDDLGATGKVLFGDNLDEIKNLANQIRLTTIPGGSSAADVEKALSALVGNRAPDALVNAMRNLAKAQEDALTLKNNTIFTKIASNNPDATIEAAQLISTPGASSSNISSIMNVLDDAQREQVKAFYMQNLLQDFGSDVMVKGDALKKFAKAMTEASKGGKLQAIFGKEMGDDMTAFGKVLEFNARTVEGGDLIAANIAASPLSNLGTLLRLGTTGRLLSSAPIYKKVMRDYNNLKKGISPEERAASLGKIIASALVQAPGQLAEDSARSADQQIRFAMENFSAPNPASAIGDVDVSQPLSPSIAPTTSTNVPAPTPSSTTAPTSTIRQRAAQNPGIAGALGLRGPTAGLINREYL